VETNIVIVESERDPEEVCEKMREKGVLALPFGSGRIRFVTHKDVNEEDVEHAIKVLKEMS